MEFKRSSEWDHLSKEAILDRLQSSQERVAILNEKCRTSQEKITMLSRKVEATETKAFHFDALLKAVEENEVVKGAWERFMMTLRLTGYDK